MIDSGRVSPTPDIGAERSILLQSGDWHFVISENKPANLDFSGEA
jgi:hypothetical protein